MEEAYPSEILPKAFRGSTPPSEAKDVLSDDPRDARMFEAIAASSSGEKDIPEESEGTGDRGLDFKKFGRESDRFLSKTEEELRSHQIKTRQIKERERKKRQKERKKLEAADIVATAPLSREAAAKAVTEQAKRDAEARRIKATQASIKRVDKVLFSTAAGEERTDSDDARSALNIRLRKQEAARQRKAATATPDVQYIDIPRSTFASEKSIVPVAMTIQALTDQGYTTSMKGNPDGTAVRLTFTRLDEREHRALMVINIFGTTSGKEVAALSRGFDCADHLDGPVTIIGAEALAAPKALTSGKKDETLPEKRALVVFND